MSWQSYVDEQVKIEEKLLSFHSIFSFRPSFDNYQFPASRKPASVLGRDCRSRREHLGEELWVQLLPRRGQADPRQLGQQERHGNERGHCQRHEVRGLIDMADNLISKSTIDINNDLLLPVFHS